MHEPGLARRHRAEDRYPDVGDRTRTAPQRSVAPLAQRLQPPGRAQHGRRQLRAAPASARHRAQHTGPDVVMHHLAPAAAVGGHGHYVVAHRAAPTCLAQPPHDVVVPPQAPDQRTPTEPAEAQRDRADDQHLHGPHDRAQGDAGPDQDGQAAAHPPELAADAVTETPLPAAHDEAVGVVPGRHEVAAPLRGEVARPSPVGRKRSVRLAQASRAVDHVVGRHQDRFPGSAPRQHQACRDERPGTADQHEDRVQPGDDGDYHRGQPKTDAQQQGASDYVRHHFSRLLNKRRAISRVRLDLGFCWE